MQYYIKRIVPILISACSVILISACIRENTIGCPQPVKVKLKYSYNILDVNIFDKKTDRAVLHIFNEEGLLIMHREIEGGIDEISIPPLKSGKYHFIAHARNSKVIDEQADLKIPELTDGVSKIEEFTAYLKRSNNEVQDKKLNDFLIGYTISDIVTNIEKRVEVSLKSVIKRVHIALLSTNKGEVLEPDRYNFKIIDNTGNGHIRYDYTQLPDKAITYKPYNKATSFLDNPMEGEVSIAVIAKINTARLIEQNLPHLIITDNLSKLEVVNVNLTWLLSLTNMENNNGRWGLQEYLDRQDNYSITLLIDSATGLWSKNTIVINGWVINMKEIDL